MRTPARTSSIMGLAAFRRLHPPVHPQDEQFLCRKHCCGRRPRRGQRGPTSRPALGRKSHADFTLATQASNESWRKTCPGERLVDSPRVALSSSGTCGRIESSTESKPHRFCPARGYSDEIDAWLANFREKGKRMKQAKSRDSKNHVAWGTRRGPAGGTSVAENEPRGKRTVWWKLPTAGQRPARL